MKEASFPVIADPAWCGNIFNSAKYKEDSYSEGGWTLSMEPSFCGRILASNLNPVNPFSWLSIYYMNQAWMK